MKKFLRMYRGEQGGATAVEYGLIAAGIALAIVSSVFLFGDSLETLFLDMQPALESIAAEPETGR